MTVAVLKQKLAGQGAADETATKSELLARAAAETMEQLDWKLSPTPTASTAEEDQLRAAPPVPPARPKQVMVLPVT